jgi:Protein of unknown function (DUF3089)
MVRHLLIAASLVATTFGGTTFAQAPPEKNDYAKSENWLCRPGRTDDACAIDLTTTVVAADGTLTKETWTGNPKAPIDCFYVYPTVSADPSPNSDMNAGNEERNVIRQQFARFASQCRPYAPLYRQVTLSGLRAALAGGTVSLDQGVGYEDVKDAWNYYLKNDNNGRGVVVIGHSQGSYVLTSLIAREIEGSPAQSRIISAILMGASVPAVKGKGVGGAFKTIPTCKSAEQTGCVISFASFRSTIPPPANTLFGRVPGDGMEAICTNPAALTGCSAPLHSYLTGVGTLIASGAPQKHQWVSTGAAVETPFVSVPGLLTAECATNENGHFLKITVNGNPADPRADDIPGDLGMVGKPQANWGLHLIDVNLAMGNLLEIVSKQSKAYLAKNK